MIRHCAPFLAALALFLPATVTAAQEPIRFARTPDVSPDGKHIAFSYLGDVWTVEAIGGVARPVTQHVAHDYYPVFSPDGRSLAFASNRHGSYDVFVASARGGKPRRLTFDSATDLPTGWSPDGKSVLFASNRTTDYPATVDLYSVPVEGGRERRITHAEGRNGVYSPSGDQIAYVRGPGEWFRKGYRGSSNDDVWMSDASGQNNRPVTTFAGQDGSPMWGRDGKTLFYVSEFFGTPGNIVRASVSNPAKPVLVTADKSGKPLHTEDGVRLARISGGGEWIVYECGADLWLLSTKEGAEPRKLAIEVHADEKTNSERVVTATSGATEFSVSKDERFLSFVVQGELFMMPVAARATPVRLTDHPANDHGANWAPDSSKVVFLSDRNGYEDVYLMEADDPEHPTFTQAHRFKVKQLTNTRDSEFGVSFSPDGARIVFIRSGKLWSMKLDGSDLKALVDQPQVIDYEWSPDGKHIVYSRMDGSFASELYVMPTAGGEAKNVTRFATTNVGVTWSADGKKLAFLSERKGTQSLFVLSLQKEAAPGAPSTDDIDFDDIHHRVAQPAGNTVSEGAISMDGQRVAFASPAPGTTGTDLWVAGASGGSVLRVTTGGVGARQITWSRKLSSKLFFLDGQGQIRLALLLPGGTPVPGTPAGSASAPVMMEVLPFKAKLTVNDSDMFAEMFDQGWRYLADSFYDPKFHGADWEAVRGRYKPLVKHVAMKEDLYSLMFLMMGELNASHLGVSSPSGKPEQLTADLGLIFDEGHHGRGMKIQEVLKRGPADKRGLVLKPGEYVLAIDGKEITPNTNISELLNDRANETVLLHLSADPKAALSDKTLVRKVELKAAARDTVHPLLYDRWVENNAKRVSELSGGKLGYIHIAQMDEQSLDRFERSLYSDCFDKEAIVLDVRFNSGGYTHEKVLNYLGTKEHTFFRHRYGTEGQALNRFDRKWTRPSLMLVNNRSFSDAEIFPSAYRTMGLGKLVGQQTGGKVIGTGSVRLIDGSTFRIPRIGVFTVAGTNMDREGVRPDYEVIPHPDQVAKGLDPQLDKAVEVLQVEVAEWKKKRATTTISKGDNPEKPSPMMPPAGKE